MNTSYSPNGGFTILFDVPHRNASDEETLTDPYSYNSSSSSSCSSPVDCTLSLGTASTRRHKSPGRNGGGIYWDLLSSKQTPEVTNRSNGNGNGNGQPDPLLARRCANCDTTSTPLWRNGPRGPKSLCNACGIRYKKEERRAAATAAQPVEPQPRNPISYGHDHPWAYAAPPASNPTLRRSQSISLSSDDNDDTAMPYLSWCLNVPHHRAEFLHH